MPLVPVPLHPLPELFRVLLLGGSWAKITGVTSGVTLAIIDMRGLITPLITTHEPPSKGFYQCLGLRPSGYPKLRVLVLGGPPGL